MLGCRQMCSLLISLEYDNGHIFNIVMYFLSVLPVVHLILQTLVTRWQKCGRMQLFHHVLLDLFYVFKLLVVTFVPGWRCMKDSDGSPV